MNYVEPLSNYINYSNMHSNYFQYLMIKKSIKIIKYFKIAMYIVRRYMYLCFKKGF